MPWPSTWKRPFFPPLSSMWNSSIPPNGPLGICRRRMKAALSPSMNVLPTPKVIQLLYSAADSAGASAALGGDSFLASAAAGAGACWAARGRVPSRHAPATRPPARDLGALRFADREFVFIRDPLCRLAGDGSEPHGASDLRAMHRLVASGAPAGPAAEEGGVVPAPDVKPAGGGLLLEMEAPCGS